MIMEILKTWSPAAVICNTHMCKEIKNANIYPHSGGDIKLYQLSSDVPSHRRTREVAKVLANIKILKINTLVVYFDQENLSEVLTLGAMMQMTGGEYKWILPWENAQSNISLPSHAFMLQPKNSTGFPENILLDAIELVKQGFRSYTDKFTKDSVPFVNCFDSASSSFGEEFYR